jgi:hypothetical protein
MACPCPGIDLAGDKKAVETVAFAEKENADEAAKRAKTESEVAAVKKIEDLKRRFEAVNQARIQAEAEKKAVEAVAAHLRQEAAEAKAELYDFLAFALALQCRESKRPVESLEALNVQRLRQSR